MSSPHDPQGGAEGADLGGLGHSGPLVTISSPSGIVKPLVAAQPPQPPPAYAAAAPTSPQHQQRPNSRTQQDPSRSVQPMYTVVARDAIASVPNPHPTAPLPVVLAAAPQPPTPRPPGSPHCRPPARGAEGHPGPALPSHRRRKAGTQHRQARRRRTLLGADVGTAEENLATPRKAPCHPQNVEK